MRVVQTIHELYKLFEKQYFQPEYRLFKRILQSCSEKNKARYIGALVDKLLRKGVFLTPKVIKEIYRLAGSESLQKTTFKSKSRKES